MTESENETEEKLVELEVAVPDEDWLQDRLDTTRYETLDDFVTQILDESVVLAEEVEDTEPEDTITITVPETTAERSEAMFDEYGEGFDDIDEILSFLLTQLFVQERMKYGGV